MPKRLLRGVIDFGDNKISVENLNVNYNHLVASKYEWHNPDERKLWTFIKGYFQNNHEAPSAALIHDWFERNNELTVTDKLIGVAAVEAYVRTHYATLLERLETDQTTNKWRKALEKGSNIAVKGDKIGEGKAERFVKGLDAAVAYVTEQGLDLLDDGSSGVTRGDVTTPSEAAEEALAYDTAKTNKDNAYGKFTGIEQIDTVCHGIKKGELWVHAGFAGGLKTTFALNWAYNTVTRYRGNVLYVSLEMKYEHLRKMAGVMHTTNGLFRSQGFRSLDYRKVRDGELDTPEDEAFYKLALKDLGENPEYHRFHIWAPDCDVTIKDIRVYAERLNKQHSVDLIVIDHAGLVKSTERDPNYSIRLNSVFRDAKKLALQFDKGKGVPVLLLHQINREGHKAAMKNSGVLDLTALSYANEAERSADVVTSTYVDDDMRAAGETQVACLKNRDNPKFPTFRAGVVWGCRRLVNREAAVGIPDMGIDDAVLQGFV